MSAGMNWFEGWACPACFSCESFEDGVLSGKRDPIDTKLKQPISVVFQSLLKSNKILGNKVAVDFSDKILTFDQLEDYSTMIAEHLRDRIGLNFSNRNSDGDFIIATMIPNSEKAIVLIMAVLKTGAAYLPLDQQYPESALLKIIEKFNPILIIADDNDPSYKNLDPTKFFKACNFITLGELWVDKDMLSSHADNNINRKSIKPQIMDIFTKDTPSVVAEHCPAVVIHTGGFIGDMTGVRIGHLSIINHCLFEWNQLQMKTSQLCSLLTPLSQADSIPQLFAPLLRGCTIYIFNGNDFKDSSNFIRVVASKCVNRLVIPCYYFCDLLTAVEKYGVGELQCVKYIVCRGGQLHSADVGLFFKLFKNTILSNCMGVPEATGDFLFETFTSVADFKRKKILGRLSLGKVMQNTKVYILNDHLGVISDGHQGELCVSGMCLGLGNVTQENAETKKHVFVKNPHAVENEYGMLLRSGQYGRIIYKDGRRRICVEGRDDHLIRQKGHQFDPEDIKHFLMELNFVKNVLVYVLNNEKASQKLVAFLVLNDKTNLDSAPATKEIEDMLRQKLPEWAIPEDFMLTKVVPTHYYSEICPCCLVQEYKEQREPKSNEWETSLVISEDKREAAITLVKAIFKMTSIPLDTILANLNLNFYEIGGNSVNTIPVLVHLNKLGYSVAFKDFYTKSSLMDLISFMANKKSQEIQGSNSSTQEVEEEYGRDLPVKSNFHIMLELKDVYSVEVIKRRHKHAVISMIVTGYCEKGLLASYNMLQKKDLEYFLEESFDSILEEKVSLVVVKKSNKKVVAAAICQDFFKLLDITKANGTLFNTIEFIHEVKGNILLFLPHRQGETLEIAWMSTHHVLNPLENVKLITLLHTEIIKLAKNLFSGIFFPSLDMLSRSICIDVFGYETFEDFQINKYQENDGTRPFHLANDAVACAALYKSLHDPRPPSTVTSLTVIDPVEYFKQSGFRSINEVQYYHKQD